uniref:Major facilitator superfamily (MFS) profile domain-containing protein n=1 Tax=Meloidogyne incognita TaxID=6306 RepID=A0A914NWX5_MELIC
TTPSFKSVYDEDIDDIEIPLRCGVGSCTPDWLQKLHTAKWLLLFLGICAFNQSFVINAIFPVDLSTLEKRFHMTSTQTGIISSWYDLAVLVVVFPVCHWGNIGHKGRWIGIGSLIMGFGSFISAMPHFISSPWPIDNLNSSDYGQCTNRVELNEHCESRRRGLLDAWYMNPYFLIFLLGQTFHGFGATPLFSLGTAYLDENVSQKSSPVYLAIHSMLTSIGPIFGLFIGGRLLQVYEDFDRVDLSTLDFLKISLKIFSPF